MSKKLVEPEIISPGIYNGLIYRNKKIPTQRK